jgi:hypothetical protein
VVPGVVARVARVATIVVAIGVMIILEVAINKVMVVDL